MSNKPYRLAQGGSRIDRTKNVHFSFDGKTLTGFAGDTVASAVMANGQNFLAAASSITARAGLSAWARRK